MSQTMSRSASQTFTVVDIQKVIRRFRADILMIAQSTDALTEAEANEYADDMDLLASKGFLKKVDVTQMLGTDELRASVYKVNTEAGGLVASAPGGVMWPNVLGSWIRVTVSYTPSYTPDEQAKLKPKLKIGWTPSSADTSHSQLKASGARDYASNAWGLQREDYSK